MRTPRAGVTCRSAASSPTQARTVSDRPPETFSCNVESSDGHVRVIPRGEVDLASADELQGHVIELREGGFDRILREVTFMDSTGLRLILAWAEEARRDGVEFGLVPGQPVVQRLFEVTGLLHRLRFMEPPTRT